MQPYSFMPMQPPNWRSLDDDEWTLVEGGSLPAPIYIQVSLSQDHRPIITGLVLGASWPRPEVTANLLREIKPREILDALYADFDPNSPPDYEAWEDSITWGLMHELHMMRTPRVPITSDAGSSAASDDAIAKFADVYLQEWARNPKSAMTAAARRSSISRATANRWAAKARDRGLLPQRPERPSSRPSDA